MTINRTSRDGISLADSFQLKLFLQRLKAAEKRSNSLDKTQRQFVEGLRESYELATQCNTDLVITRKQMNWLLQLATE